MTTPATPPEAEARPRKKDTAKKRQEDFEAAVEDARYTADEAKLDVALMGAEVVGDLPESAGREALEAAERDAAERRRAYSSGFAIDSRKKAAWAARKLAEARTRKERAQEIMRAEVRRAEAEQERREEFFLQKLLWWAKQQERDTPHSIRMPEAGVRLELRPLSVGGVQILDEKEACASAIDRLGLMEALASGIVRCRYELVPEAARAYALAHPEAQIAGIVSTPAEEIADGKLVIVRI